MRLIGILVLILSYFTSFAQKTDALINTWVPINVTDYEGETDLYGSKLMLSIYSFNKGNKGEHFYGGIDYGNYFKYEIRDDTLIFSVLDFTPYNVLILENTETSLKLFFDSMNVVSYIPFPKKPVNLDNEKIPKILSSDYWNIKQTKGKNRLALSLDFRNEIEDSSLVKPFAYKYVNDLYIPSTIIRNEYPHLWSLSQLNGISILMFEEIMSSGISSSLFFLEKYNMNKMSLYRWNKGIKEYFKGVRQRKTNKEKVTELSILTQSVWKIEREKVEREKRIRKKDLIDLGMVYDNFYNPDEDYVHDSTLLITKNDITRKELRLRFNADGSYEILKRDNVIDSGKWKGYFNNTFLKIESDTKFEHDGIISGHIEILHLSKNKLVLKRQFHTILNGDEKDERSLIETYSPVR